MIPTMLLVGLAVGRSWAIPLGGVAWAAILVVAPTRIGVADLPIAAALGAANVAIGVLVRWLVAQTVRALRPGRGAQTG